MTIGIVPIWFDNESQIKTLPDDSQRDVTSERGLRAGKTAWGNSTCRLSTRIYLLASSLDSLGREISAGIDENAPHLERQRSRSVSAKCSLALREFALGIEALERFGRQEPLRRVHECVFGVLAVESEPVDPRL